MSRRSTTVFEQMYSQQHITWWYKILHTFSSYNEHNDGGGLTWRCEEGGIILTTRTPFADNGVGKRAICKLLCLAWV